MNIYWALFFTLMLSLFIAGETYALAKGKPTLSRFIWNLTKAWPPLPLVVGLAIGFVSAHFWWGGSLICY
jgi:hypothetical protein